MFGIKNSGISISGIGPVIWDETNNIIVSSKVDFEVEVKTQSTASSQGKLQNECKQVFNLFRLNETKVAKNQGILGTKKKNSMLN